MSAVTLIGYRHSVYTRIARMALHQKGVAFTEAEVNPFDPPLPPDHPHPFGRVPVLTHASLTVFETSAITRYIDLAFPGPPLVPAAPQAAARMQQVIAIADAYAFRPLVLQVYAQRVFRPLEGLVPHEAQIAEGLAAAPKVLAALDRIAAEGLALSPAAPSLAECHLAPMIAAFVAARAGAEALTDYPALSHWWASVQRLPSFRASGRDHMAT
ncbi:MAG: glutathione S-transferase family protein [Rhodobacterales bacterium]|nr:MAG: glutathione S-transferase family protein [Rhodobacterales bacterium]